MSTSTMAIIDNMSLTLITELKLDIYVRVTSFLLLQNSIQL